MKRRNFLIRVAAPALLSPWILGLSPRKDRGALYLITDAPQDSIVPLMEQLYARGLVRGKSFALSPVHPREREIGRALDGWSRVPDIGAADLSIEYASLHSPRRPSFALVQNGRVVDLRRTSLLRLWKEMQASGPATGLTVVAFRPESRRNRAGSWASVTAGGDHCDRIPLETVQTRTYRASGGRIVVRVERGSVRVEESPCPHKVCVSTPAISSPGERIVCAPNRFMIEIEGRRTWDMVLG